MMLEIHGLTKTFQGPQGAVRALDGVSLTIAPGEFVALQGPSGCGKTTLLLSAGGLLAPDGGRVIVDGQDPYSLTADARARFRAATVGFVFQQFHLVPYLSVLDNVLAPALARPAADARPRAEELLAHFGLAHRSGHVPGKLSTGERQRAALARALLNRPRLLLADEPTGNLDDENSEAVLEALADFARGGGGVLLASHDAHAVGYADRSIRIRDGRLVGQPGTVEVAAEG